jgi:ankyrin repeat domain-containing protein 50
MDPLSATASVVAVIQISGTIFDLCRTYFISVKDARKDIQRLQNEITSLQDVLVSLLDLVDTPNAASLQIVKLAIREGGPVQQCQSELAALAERIDIGEKKGQMQQFGLRALKWPLSSKDIDKALLTIERHKASISLALASDQT